VFTSGLKKEKHEKPMKFGRRMEIQCN